MSVLLFIALTLSCANQQQQQKPKYVFYFIGDGMGFTHLSISEAYQQYMENGEIGSKPLSFTQFPVMGMATNYSKSHIITCSSAAGTALSTGHKTNNYYLGVSPDSTKLESISYKIHNSGKKVGILTSVTIDHATPAAFYAHSISRSDYYSIAKEIATSGFEFFAGGGLLKPTGEKEDQPSAYDYIEENGYTILSGIEDFEKNKTTSDKVLLLQNNGRESRDLPYAIDRKEGDTKLSDLVKAAIEYLDNENGFFMMAEGGKIDWASHANDAKTAILETIDFSNAIEVAYKFYLEHPNETLIVVTADHETGGLSFGKEKGYEVYFEELDSQISSKDVTADTYEKGGAKKEIEEANKKAKMGWSTKSHTGTAIPIFAIGIGSENFAGRMDNTDIPKKICKSLGIAF